MYLQNSFKTIGNLIALNFGGTSGPLYAAFFIKGSQRLNKIESMNKTSNWIEAFEIGVKMIKEISQAEIGDRTMLDILFDLIETFNQNKSSDLKNFKACVNNQLVFSLEKIKNLKAKRGRSCYLEGKEIGKPDPGSVLVALWINFYSIRFANDYKLI